jgi:hypothetical protein
LKNFEKGLLVGRPLSEFSRWNEREGHCRWGGEEYVSRFSTWTLETLKMDGRSTKPWAKF